MIMIPNQGDAARIFYIIIYIVGEPDPKFGKVQGWRGTEDLTTDSYVKIPDGSESGLRTWD